MAALILLTACHGGKLQGLGHARFDVTVENRREGEVLVSFLVYQWKMGPCSMRHEGALVCGPLGQPTEVRVVDVAGGTVYTASVTAEDRGRDRLARLFVRISPEGVDACAQDDRSAYWLTVENRLWEEVDVWLDGTELGTVKPVSQRRFGPLSGNWEAARSYVIRNATGREMQFGAEYLLSSAPVVYILGQIPEVGFSITPGYHK